MISPLDGDNADLLGLLHDSEDGDAWLELAQSTLLQGLQNEDIGQQGLHGSGAMHAPFGKGPRPKAATAGNTTATASLQQQRQQQDPGTPWLAEPPAGQASTSGAQLPVFPASSGGGGGHGAKASSAARPPAVGRAAVRRAARARERSTLGALEERLQAVASLHMQLQAENGMLRRRMRLLESGVHMREQHLQVRCRAGWEWWSPACGYGRTAPAGSGLKCLTRQVGGW